MKSIKKKEKHKIIFVMGGITPYFQPIAEKLNEHFEIQIIRPDQDLNWNKRGVATARHIQNFTVHALPTYQTYYGKEFFRKITQLVSKEKPDILVLAWPYGLALGLNLFFLFTIKRLGIKVLIREIPFKVPILSKALQPFKMGELDVDENRGFNDSPPVKNVGDWCKFIIATTSRILYYNLADGFLCYHEGGLNIISSYGIKRNKIFPILNSSDTSQLRAWRQELVGNQIKTHPYRIIHVGRLVKWKKVDLLLYAFQQVLAALPGAELVVIGTGPEEENLKLLTRDLGLDKSVHFKGGVYDPKQLAEELFISQVYVLAGMGGLSINDAMAMGKPVICSVCDGTERHLLRDGLNGFFFEENNVQDLAHKIKVILQSPQLCLKMGENSARIIEEEVNEKVAIKQYIQAFESTLA